MKLRAPAVPLITVDPYFSVWSAHDRLNDGNTVHWTCKPNSLTGIICVDGDEYVFMGVKEGIKPIEQIDLSIDALSTAYLFRTGEVELKLTFTTPLLLDDLKVMARSVSYLHVDIKSLDGAEHEVFVSVQVDDDICLDVKNESPTHGDSVSLRMDAACAKMGNVNQHILNKVGDDVRINWGYFYLVAKGENARVLVQDKEEQTSLIASVTMVGKEPADALFIFAYDDIYCLQYFNDNIKSYWTRESEDICEIIEHAIEEYDEILNRCERFSEELFSKAVESGGEKYAELLMLAYRQSIAAHKLCADTQGELLFISKECFSNGCAATVDVTYPSIPLFLLYNPQLIEGMLRPIFKYAATETWCYDFAPHDAGTYPLINGQTYGNGTDYDQQMPIEECGNMLITIAALSLALKDFSFAKKHLEFLKQWADYLVIYGEDPDNQLCTDDFAGHLAHNCNLSIKAIMGISSYSIILKQLEQVSESNKYYGISKLMADRWVIRASNPDGTFKLTFDQMGSYSMKYNMIWDQLFDTGLFPEEVIGKELHSYLERINPFGMPLDNRADYTKSDWLVWCGSLMKDKKDFETYIDPLWHAYNETESRVPMTDWFSTITAKQIGFQNRSVQGGLFMKLLMSEA